MNILVIGSGGREHALVDALARSKAKHRLFALPGNPGIAGLARCISGSVTDEELLWEVCQDKAIDLVVFGPEQPLAAGMADLVRSWGILAFGPGQAGAELETSKVFAKQFMSRHGIETAKYQVVTSYEEMKQAKRLPVVIKADGLAAGKGVFIPNDDAEYDQVAKELFLDKSLGDSANQVILEDCLVGEEISFFYLLNGKDSFYLGSARDHKRAYDGSKGPNTGGMGAFTPVEMTEQDKLDIALIVKNTVTGLQAEGIDFRGVAFIGCMRTEDGLSVLEYNVRFGDPETQALQAQWGTHLDELLIASAKGLAFPAVEIKQTPSVCVVMCSQGYPGKTLTAQPIQLGPLSHSQLFHAGTALENGVLVNRGGRVFNVVAQGETIEQARQLVYDDIRQISFTGSWYRKDIAL